MSDAADTRRWNGEFEGKVVVVVGGSSGLGLHAAKRFREEGAQVVIAARNAERLDAAAREIDAVAIQCDATSFEELEELAESVKKRFGRIDVALNSAGLEQSVRIRDIEKDDVESMVAVQFTGAVYFIKHMANRMQAGGVVISMSSLTSLMPAEGYAAYAGAKAGLNHVTKIAAAEYAPEGIRVHALAPTVVETPMTAHILAMEPVKNALLEHAPLGRLGECADVSEAALFLASDRSSYLTGLILPIDGGPMLKKMVDNNDVMRHFAAAAAASASESE
jgi:NAD(P)-dependent dehydrogenase (short-subunit alcohol dehydrogenase family)